jgi:tRNA (mo5U34)-methyltransferase
VKNPYRQLVTSKWAELAELGWNRLENNPHGDMPAWLKTIGELPAGDGFCDLDKASPRLGKPAKDPSVVHQNLQKLHPWRKGPLELAGTFIDTEWRSDWKWQRLAPYLDLEDQAVLDIGCGNGYFGLRMLGAGADLVLGIDPTLVFVMQWLAMHRLCPDLQNYVLPLGIEDLPDDCRAFDSVFSMGVLYHRKDAIEHLRRLKQFTRPGGQIVLETLVLEGENQSLLEPSGRYARMRNVHAVPSLSVLLEWLQQAGLNDTRVLDISKTSTAEQRSTSWMRFESLADCLDPNDPSLTVEGHPAPVRAALLINA